MSYLQPILQPILRPVAQAINSGGMTPAYAELNLMAGTLDSRITFTRASTKTYFGSDGLMHTATVDECPLEYDPVTLLPMGRSFWEARANLLYQSSDYSANIWSKAGGGVGAAPAVTTSAGIAPDGTNTACRLIFAINGGTTSEDQSTLSQSSNTVTGVSYVQSIWARSFDGVSTYKLRFSFNGSNPIIITITPQWQRFVLSFVANDTIRGYRLALRGGVGTSDSADILAFGAQREQATFVGPYIPTTTYQVTRAADVATVNDLRTLRFNATEGTLYADGDASGTLNSVAISIDDGTGNNRMDARFTGMDTTAGRAQVWSSGVLQRSYEVGNTSQIPRKIALAYAPGQSAFAFNGLVSSASGDVIPSGLSIVRVGSATFGGLANAHIRRIRYYPRRLTDAQLQDLTA